MNTSSDAQSSPQIRHQERRAEIIDAAIRAFARKGFGGSTLADIAVEAGVSQPRISQIFGSKQNAFIVAHRRAADYILGLLSENAQPPYSMKSFGAGMRQQLNREPAMLMMLFQGLTDSYVPAIAEESRRVIQEIVELVDRAGGTPEDARILLERGYFLYAMLSIGVLGHVDEHPSFSALLESVSMRDVTS